MDEQRVSFHDAQLLSLIDKALADAIKLWSLRPAPSQRLVRVEFGKSFTELRAAMTDEEFELSLPETKKVAQGLMARMRW